MKRIFMLSVFVVAVALLTGAAIPTAGNARDLTIVSWGGAYQEAQRKAYFSPFMKKTGKKILKWSRTGPDPASTRPMQCRP